MASNFQQHMGGPGQMMQQQRMQQQRPPQSNQASMQIQQVIYNALNSQTGPLSGWQAQVLINERITLIFNIIGNLRLASQHQPNAPPLQKMVEIGIKFEKDIFERCGTKDQYKHEVQVKLEQLLERRNQQQATLQQTIHQQAQAQAQAQQAQAQQMLMNQNMQGQGMGMPQQPGQQGFAHLQHPMQASQLPGQQSQQNAMGMQNQGLPQNPTQNQQQQFQMAMQQQQQQQQQNQTQQSQNVTARPNGNQPSLSQQDNQLVSDLTNRLVGQTSEEDKNNIRARLRTQMDPASFQKCQAQGMDPIVLYFRQQAIGRLRAERSRAQQLQLAQGQNMPGGTPMQPQRSMQPSPAQPAAATAGNPDFSSFMGNMGDLAAQQQQQGVMAEQSGQIVVPASGAPRNPTPQPGVMSGQGMNMNDQRGVAGSNPRTQQMFNAQQLQHQQRLQHAQAQQQQSQTQARLNAQKNAQHIALQGQPGGMGPGPVPQQSPAMQTLNAPMRTPSQQNNHAELPQANPNAQFGQPVDPRFMQGTQRQLGQGNGMNAAGLNPAMFANMAQGLPPDKLNEVVNKWNNSTNGPGGKPGMTMQGNPQARPGMPGQQPGQLNAQNQAAQFAMANGGQRPPPNMMSAMNPQQQMLLQQQMAALRPGQVPPRNMPPNVMQMEQRNLLQMDAADIPPIFLTQAGMPQGFPPEVKKWGQMKQWVTQNPNLGPNALEGVKNFQRLHFQQIMQRSRQQHQSGAIPPNQGGMPGAMQTGGPGMAAPVAPMGPNPMMTQGMPVPQLRQPTAQEILSIRNHVSGKLANATDDQIRHIFMNNQLKAQQQAQAQAQAQGQMNPQQQQEQQRQLYRLKQMQQQQNSSQQTQPGQAPQPNMTSVQNQAKQIPTPQPKPAAATSKPATSSNTPNQATRTQPNARNAVQNASPAQPVNKLKRQNSDDVVEVPNPNTQQQQPSQAQSSNPKPQPKFTTAQLAQMNPEMRKRYEIMMKSNQLNPTNGPNAIPPADQMKLKEISKQEEQDNQHSLQDIPMDAETKQKMRKILESIVGPLSNVSRVVGKWFQLTLDEDQARKFFRARYRLAKQFQDQQMQRPKDTFSIWPQEVEAARALLGNMVKDLTAKYPDLKKPNATKTQAPSQAPQPSQAAQPQTPLNAANLQQQQQQLNKLAHQRSNSRSSHTPAAPTSSQPPFQLGAKSPQGTPIYAPKNTIDVDKLHIPARKKQKHAPAPGQGTPGSNSSPQVAKAVSPEMKRQQQPEMKSQPKPALCCQEPDCERHQVGFENEEELKKHTNEEHIGPLENPSKYVQESMTAVLGLDSQGQLKKPAAPAIPDTAPKMVATNSKQGQTPIKPGNTPSAATPMMRQASMNRQASANGIKPNMPSKGTSAKEVTNKAVEQKDVKQAENKTPAPLEFNDPWADSMIDPNELFGVFQQFETGAGGSISDMNVFRGITPNDTPESSKDGVSEPNSDISDGVALDINLDLFDSNWQPFGPSDTEGLNDLNFTIANDEDLTMFDEEPSLGYATFDDIDTSMFDKPFSLDTGLFSLDGN